MSTFSRGDFVKIKKLNKNGVIGGILKNGKLKVIVGGISITCSEEELSALSEQHKPECAPPLRGKKKLPSHKVREIDLHGFTVSRAEQAVLEGINRAIIDGEHRLHIVHGHGTGKVREAMHQLLNSLDVIKRYELSRGNAGVTVVYF
ncbi:MAG: Smr/MutS family protein [Bdellovibrionales bacterium]|nr:Smr/MutS family protein [Bdellovibrionales bacterium]